LFFLSVIIFIIIFCYNKKHTWFRRRALIYLPFCLVWNFLLGISVSCLFVFFLDFIILDLSDFLFLLFLVSVWLLILLASGFHFWLDSFCFPWISYFWSWFLFPLVLDFLVLDLVFVSIGFGFLILGFYFWTKSLLLLVSDIFLWVQPCFLNLPFFFKK